MTEALEELNDLLNQYVELLKLNNIPQTFVDNYLNKCEVSLASDDTAIKEKASLMLAMSFHPLSTEILCRRIKLLNEKGLLYALTSFKENAYTPAINIILDLIRHPNFTVSTLAGEIISFVAPVGDTAIINSLKKLSEENSQYLKYILDISIDYLETGNPKERDKENDRRLIQLDVGNVESEKALLLKEKTIEYFHQWYYYTRMNSLPLYCHTYWMGHVAAKCPLDLWIYQEIFFEVRPEVIVECGTSEGGSAAFYSSMCYLLGNCEVISIDIELTESAKRVGMSFPAITLIEGSSTDPEVVKKVREIVNGRKAIVILDSDHKMDHVLSEMQLYNDMVPVGSYMIVEDGNLNGHPVFPFFGPGPQEAVDAFLKTNNNFEIDKKREKFILTFNPNGYLRRVR